MHIPHSWTKKNTSDQQCCLFLKTNKCNITTMNNLTTDTNNCNITNMNDLTTDFSLHSEKSEIMTAQVYNISTLLLEMLISRCFHNDSKVTTP